METFTLGDIMTGNSRYSKSALVALRNFGVRDNHEHHYAKIRLTAGLSNSVLVAISIIPYGESVYADTVSLQCKSAGDLATTIFAYVSNALGGRVGDKVVHWQFRKIAEWLGSVQKLGQGGAN
jgi:hypothetical protein